MENITNQLIRTCSACGIEKPLSAFLQLGGEHGTSYGKICAQCRSLGKTSKPAVTTNDDERSTTPSGIGIRGKEKIYADAKREQKIHTLKELYQKETAKKEEAADEKITQVNTIEAAEKKHRESYIAPNKNAVDEKAYAPQQSFARQQAQKTMNIQNALAQHTEILKTTTKQHVETVKSIEKEEIKKTTTDFNNLGYALTPRAELQSAEIKKFFAWLGDAPIVQALERKMIGERKAQKELVTENSNKATDPSRRQR